MRYLLFIVLFVTCNEPRLVIVDYYDQKAINEYVIQCIEDHKSSTAREVEYYREICLSQAKNKFYHLDSMVVMGDDTIPWHLTKSKIRNQVKNILR